MLARPLSASWLSLGGGLASSSNPAAPRHLKRALRRKGEPNRAALPIGTFPALSVADARRKLGRDEIGRQGRPRSCPRAPTRSRRGLDAPNARRSHPRISQPPREDQVAAKTLKIERDLLVGVLAPVLGDRLLADLEPIDFGKSVTDYAARLKREGRSNGTNANKLLAASRRMFKAARGWGIVGSVDPTAGLYQARQGRATRPYTVRRKGSGRA